MGAGVNHGVGLITMWQVDVRAGIAEAELQDSHAGHLQTFAKRVDLGGDEAEVLGNERQVAELFTQHEEQIFAGTIDPAAMHRGGFAVGNLPVLLEVRGSDRGG